MLLFLSYVSLGLLERRVMETEMKFGRQSIGLTRLASASVTEQTFKCSFSEELYGDFEDLETGDVHKGQPGPDAQVWL